MSGTRFVQLVAPFRLDSVPVGRCLLRDTLVSWDLVDVLDVAELATTELLTNAVLHACTGFRLTVSVEPDRTAGGCLLVQVHDLGTAWKPRRGDTGVQAHDALLPGWDAENGRGLALVGAVTDSWGVRAKADGTTVWFRLVLPPARGRAAG